MTLLKSSQQQVLLQHCYPMDQLSHGVMETMAATPAMLTLMVMAIQRLTLGARKLLKSTRQLMLLQHCETTDQFAPGETKNSGVN